MNINSDSNHLPKEIAEYLDRQDGQKDGKIKSTIWNAFVEDKGGKKITNYIALDNAIKSISVYANKASNENESKADILSSWLERESNSSEQVESDSVDSSQSPQAEETSAQSPQTEVDKPNISAEQKFNNYIDEIIKSNNYGDDPKFKSVYTMQRGDTLYKIAEKVLKIKCPDLSPKELKSKINGMIAQIKANNLHIKDVNNFDINAPINLPVDFAPPADDPNPPVDPNPPAKDSNPPVDPNPPAKDSNPPTLNSLYKSYFEMNKDERQYVIDNKILAQVAYNYDGSVKEYDTYEYDAKGNETKFVNYNSDGTVDTYWTSEYDANGNRTKWVEYNSDGSVKEYVTYEYDANGNGTKSVKYNSDGSVDWYETYEYDANGNETKGVEYNSDGSVEEYFTYEYVSDGNETIYVWWYNSDGSARGFRTEEKTPMET